MPYSYHECSLIKLVRCYYQWTLKEATSKTHSSIFLISNLPIILVFVMFAFTVLDPLSCVYLFFGQCCGFFCSFCFFFFYKCLASDYIISQPLFCQTEKGRIFLAFSCKATSLLFKLLQQPLSRLPLDNQNLIKYPGQGPESGFSSCIGFSVSHWFQEVPKLTISSWVKHFLSFPRGLGFITLKRDS